MKKLLSLVVFSLGLAVFAAEPPGKLFEANFDDFSQNASFGAGDLKAYDFPESDLQLRMYSGVGGKGNSLPLANSERCWYKAAGHINSKQGTIAIWMQMIDYDLGDAALQGYYTINGEPEKGSYFYFRLLRNKNEWKNFIIGQIVLKQPGMAKPWTRQLQYYLGPGAWKAKTWHHVALTWDKEHFRMYLDGVCPKPVKYEGKTRYDNESKSIPFDNTDVSMEGRELPDMPANGRINLGNTFATAPADAKTAFDSIQIYDRPLTASEIKGLYEALIPPQKKTAVPQFAGIPWSDDGSQTVRLFLNQPMLKPELRLHVTADLWRDADNLYCNFQSDRPNKTRVQTERDGKLWEDDSFELHLKAPDNENYQFIVNGNGAIFDHRNRDAKWNCEGVKADVRLEENGWGARLTVPLASLSSLEGDWLMDVSTAAIAGNKEHYWRWSNVIYDNSFGATGQMKFLPKGVWFAPVSLGDLEHGALDLQAKGANNVTVTASYLPINNVRETFPGNLLKTPWKTTLPAGEQSLNIEAKAGEQLVYRYQADYYVDFPMEITFNTVAREGRIDVKIDFANAGGDVINRIRKEGLSGTLELLTPDGKVDSTGSFSAKEAQTTAVLPFPKHPFAGAWSIRAKAGDLERTVAYRVPDMRPYQAKVAVDHTVPEPWTPIEAAGDNAWRLWNRVYQFDGASPFPRQILVGGKPVFLKAPALELNGAAATWTPWKVVESHPDVVKFAGQGTVGGVPVAFTSELWFDGMYRLDWSLESAEKASIDAMRIAYRLPTEFARYAMDPGYVPWKDDRVAITLLPKSGSRKNNVLWLSGYDKGLFFWTKSNANWANQPGEAPLKAVRSKEWVDASLDIITRKVELSGKAGYTMVFQATPSRPFPKNFRDINYLSYNHFKGAHYELSGTGGASDRPRSDDPAYIFGLWPRDPVAFAKDMYAPEIRRHPYTSPGCLSDLAPDFDFWDHNTLNAPGSVLNGSKLGVKQTAYRFCQNATDAPADLWAWWADEMMKQFHTISGLYFDLATVIYCESEQHGCAGTDAFGQRFISNDALGMRNFFMRCYKVSHAHGYDVCIHCHTVFMPMSHICDFFAPGENTFRLCSANFEWGYCEDITDDEWLTEYNQFKAGVAYLFILQNGRVCSIIPSMKKFKQRTLEEEELAFHSVTPLAIRDIDMFGHYVSYSFIERYWAMRGKAGLGAATKFHGYWESDAVKSPAAKVSCGWYEFEKPSPYRRVIVVGNESRENAVTKLNIDWKKLGIAPADLEDLWDGKTYTPENILDFSLPGGHFTYLGVK